MACLEQWLCDTHRDPVHDDGIRESCLVRFTRAFGDKPEHTVRILLGFERSDWKKWAGGKDASRPIGPAMGMSKWEDFLRAEASPPEDQVLECGPITSPQM